MKTIIKVTQGSLHLVSTDITLDLLHYVELPIQAQKRFVIHTEDRIYLHHDPANLGFPVKKTNTEGLTPFKKGDTTYFKAVKDEFVGELKLITPEVEEVWVNNPLRLCKVYKDTYFDTNLQFVERHNMENIVTLDNGIFLHKHYGKYKSNLSILTEMPEIKWESIKAQDLNLETGKYESVIGEFFTSKKGTKCFRVNPKGKHMLIREDWGGAFCSGRGRHLPENGLYFRRASSNGGGSGYDYAVLPRNWKQSLSEDDI